MPRPGHERDQIRSERENYSTGEQEATLGCLLLLVAGLGWLVYIAVDRLN